jgi:hypothetical protein
MRSLYTSIQFGFVKIFADAIQVIKAANYDIIF